MNDKLLKTFDGYLDRLVKAENRVYDLKENQSSATIKVAKSVLESSGRSLRSVALKMGISAPYLCDLLSGKRAWSRPLILRFSKAATPESK